MKNIITAIFIISLFISGCASQKRSIVVKAKEIPAWYKTPRASSATTLYAVGEGENRDEAVANALNSMASTLSVSISSEFNTRSVVKDGADESFNSTSVNEIKSSVKKIRISSYDVLESEQLGFKKYIVLIRSYKQELFNSLKDELDQKFTMIHNRFSNANKFNAIKRLSIYKEAKESVADVPNTLIVMSVLNNSFNKEPYLQSVKKVRLKYDELLSSITFSVQSNEAAQNLKSVIRKGLSEKRLTLKDSSGKNHFNIFISSKVELASSYGFNLARSAISITVKDVNDAIIGSNKLNITGQSTQGYEIAKENVAAKLSAMVEKDGIAKVIGLEL